MARRLFFRVLTIRLCCQAVRAKVKFIRNSCFMRKTSIDELPQLFNVLKGEMSIVGNRPLPLYEAEYLTDDKYIERFSVPAGITGWWQVSKRGGSNMTEEERQNLDNEYAQKMSFWFDLLILFKTPFVLFSREEV
ncbi:MAG: sugar transferase [Bacteroidales bacterium]|nr:sugar transferase [Bacteroidales bacterium]MCF8458468.1 sugar transferase [Bacteroidales bacterium]